MMKVSTKSTYAIRALLYLAKKSGDAPMRLPTIAETQKIPLPFLEQIFSKLRRSGIVESIRGPQGGYKLSRNPADISLGQIIATLEGPPQPVLCTMPENHTPDCHEVEGCVSRLLCSELDGELSRVLSRNTLSTLLGKEQSISHGR